MPMQVILLERVDSLGNLGDIVTVKPGFARNFLIPQSKALRATKDNIAYFEARKKEIEKQNDARRKDAEKLADKLKGLTVTLIRLASEDGRLFGSVAARDISEAVSGASKLDISRTMVVMNRTYKELGLFPVTLTLHAEVKVDVTVNIARSEEEAAIQLKTGKALVAVDANGKAVAAESTDSAKEGLLDEEALKLEQERSEEQSRKEAEKAEKSAKKKAKKSSKKEEVAESEDASGEDGEV